MGGAAEKAHAACAAWRSIKCLHHRLAGIWFPLRLDRTLTVTLLNPGQQQVDTLAWMF